MFLPYRFPGPNREEGAVSGPRRPGGRVAGREPVLGRQAAAWREAALPPPAAAAWVVRLFPRFAAAGSDPCRPFGLKRSPWPENRQRPEKQRNEPSDAL